MGIRDFIEATKSSVKILHDLKGTLSRLSAIQDAQRALISDVKVLKRFTLPQLVDVCRVQAQSAYMGEETILCRVIGQYLLYADAKDSKIVPSLALNGRWEPWVTLTIARTVQPGWKCLDVGANHGYYTLLLADLVGESGHVIAIEPTPKLTGLVKRSLVANSFTSQVTLVEQAVCDRAGEAVKLVIPVSRGMNAGITRSVSVGDEVIEVSTTTVDQLTQDWNRVDFIKIDVEGAEEMVWRGMTATLERNPDITLVMEFNNGRYDDPKGFLLAIQQAGFVLRHIDFDAEIKPLTVEQALTERPNQDWLLFLQRR